jgi:hypothetical protein
MIKQIFTPSIMESIAISVKIYWYTKRKSHDLNPLVSIQKGFYCKNSVISKKILNTTTKT